MLEHNILSSLVSHFQVVYLHWSLQVPADPTMRRPNTLLRRQDQDRLCGFGKQAEENPWDVFAENSKVSMDSCGWDGGEGLTKRYECDADPGS